MYVVMQLHQNLRLKEGPEDWVYADSIWVPKITLAWGCGAKVWEGEWSQCKVDEDCLFPREISFEFVNFFYRRQLFKDVSVSVVFQNIQYEVSTAKEL